MRIANIDDVILILLEDFKVPYHHHHDRNHLHHCFCSMSMIIKVSTHLSSLMTVTTLTTMITAKNDHSKQRHCFCKLDHSAHQDDHHYTHDRRFCCYITIVARGGRRHHAVRKIAPAAPSVPLGLLLLRPPATILIHSWWRGHSITHAFCFKSCSSLGHTISICK